MPVIEVDGLCKSYGAFEAVRGISFHVDEGEVVAVLGPNGAGKTSTVEVLEGYRPRNAGTVSVLGMDPATGGSELRHRIGIVLQECGVEPYLSVREVLLRHSEFYRRPRDVDEVIGLVGLGEKATARVKTSRVASSDGSTWRSVSSAIRSCCSSMNRPPASTPPLAARHGTSSEACATSARPSC